MLCFCNESTIDLSVHIKLLISLLKLCKINMIYRSGIHGITIEDRIFHEAEALCDVIRQKNGQPFILEVKTESFKFSLYSYTVNK